MASIENLKNDYLKIALGSEPPSIEGKQKDEFVTNRKLTALTGLTLLFLLLLQIFTTIDLRTFRTLHIFLGSLIVGFFALKTFSVSQKMVSYYLGRETYKKAGPPELLFRLLGPLFLVVSWILVLSGTLMIVGFEEYTQVGPFTLREIHGDMYVVFLILGGVHLLGRLAPALREYMPKYANTPQASTRTHFYVFAASCVLSLGWAYLVVSQN